MHADNLRFGFASAFIALIGLLLASGGCASGVGEDAPPNMITCYLHFFVAPQGSWVPPAQLESITNTADTPDPDQDIWRLTSEQADELRGRIDDVTSWRIVACPAVTALSGEGFTIFVYDIDSPGREPDIEVHCRGDPPVIIEDCSHRSPLESGKAFLCVPEVAGDDIRLVVAGEVEGGEGLFWRFELGDGEAAISEVSRHFPDLGDESQIFLISQVELVASRDIAAEMVRQSRNRRLEILRQEPLFQGRLEFRLPESEPEPETAPAP